MSIKKEVREALKQKFSDLTPRRINQKIIETGKKHGILNRDIAGYVFAHDSGIRLSKYLDSQMIGKVESAIQNGPRIIETKENRRGNSKSLQTETQNNGYPSLIIKKIISVGQKYGIENIDGNWIDALATLNFIETITTKFLMDHDYSEDVVKNMKWEEKLTKLQNKLHEEAKTKGVTIRTSVGTFFKNYREVRNDQDHIAHLPTSHVTKGEIGLLQKNLDMFVTTVFVEHKKYCSKQNSVTSK